MLGLTYDDPFWKGDDITFEPDVDNPHKPDTKHLPRLGVTSVVLGSNPFPLEEAIVWACFVCRNDNENGRFESFGRESAWGMSALTTAALLAPDTHPLKNYLMDRVEDNIAWFALNYNKDSPLGVYEMPDNWQWRQSGRKAAPCAQYVSFWQYAWCLWGFVQMYKFFGDPVCLELAAHHWKWVQPAYLKKPKWTAPDGEVITWNNVDHAYNYSTMVGTYTPEYDDQGKWRVKEGSVRTISNMAQTLWYLAVYDEHSWTIGTDPYPTWPDKGPEAIHWRPWAD